MHGAKSSFAKAWYRLGTRRRLAYVTAERWRYDHDPLPRYPTPAADVGHVRGTIKSYDLKSIADLQANGTVCLLAVTAVKRPPAA